MSERGIRERSPFEFARERFERLEGRALFRANWKDLVFLNYRLNPEVVAPWVPLPLDIRDGWAYLSLVAFRVSEMRLDRFGRWNRHLVAPFGAHRFLNVRAYVKNEGEPGIFFIKEYVDRRFAIPFAKMTYGLPYVYAKIDYDRFEGEVDRGERKFRFKTILDGDPHRCVEGSLEEFLCERYTAFTSRGRSKKRFRIVHEPWEVAPLEIEDLEDELPARDLPFWEETEFVGGLYSPGAFGVRISKPGRVFRELT